MNLRLPLFVDVDPRLIPAIGVQIQLVPKGSGFDGQLNAAVRQGDVSSLTVLGLLAMIAADPYDHPQVDQIFDDNHDGVISEQEILDNAIIKNVTNPDLAIFDRAGNWAPDPKTDGRNALSIGIWFHLEPCASGSCVTTQPTDTCHDRAKDADESNLDCGGAGECMRCLDGAACRSDGDCQSGKCENGSCAGNSCSDIKVDGDESDLDCGGSCPVKCQRARRCRVDDDCASGLTCTLNSYGVKICG